MKIYDEKAILGKANQASEECGELVQALAKLRRLVDRDPTLADSPADVVNSLVEELADVELVTADLVRLLKVRAAVETIKDYKIRRTIERGKR